MTLIIGLTMLLLLWYDERWLPGKAVALCVVAVSIVLVAVFGLTKFNVVITGTIPPEPPCRRGRIYWFTIRKVPARWPWVNAAGLY
jgi:hypothetical protein